MLPSDAEKSVDVSAPEKFFGAPKMFRAHQFCTGGKEHRYFRDRRFAHSTFFRGTKHYYNEVIYRLPYLSTYGAILRKS